MGGPGSGRHATGRTGLSNNKQYAKNSPRGIWKAKEARAVMKGQTARKSGRK
jgi:hypothetical protein